jgi:phage terminase small subunit
MANKKTNTPQPRGGTTKKIVNIDGRLMQRLPRNIKGKYLNGSDEAEKVFLTVWEDLRNRALNFASVFDLVVIYAIEVSTYYYCLKMIKEKGHIEFTDRNVPMVSPWVKIQRQSSAEITKLAYRLGIDPNTRVKMPEAPEAPEEKPKGRFDGV